MENNSLIFPIVLKPDFGQRGQDVEVVRDQESMRSYLDRAVGVTLIQEHIDGQEFGVFYMSFPEENKTKITFPNISVQHIGMSDFGCDGGGEWKSVTPKRSRLRVRKDKINKIRAEQKNIKNT